MGGVVRFGRSSMYHKKAIYKFVEKKVGGAKNGGTRMVRVKKLANDYPTAAPDAKRATASCFKSHARKLRASIAPGVVAIVLAGVHKGKHVVVLKQLASGLLVVTGPMSLNGCPTRRINQRFIIATKTKIDISSVKVPENIDDAYFARVKAEKSKKGGDIFDAKKEEYKPSDQRKADQAAVDKQVLAAIKSNKEALLLKQYLKSSFALSKGQFPHNMVF